MLIPKRMDCPCECGCGGTAKVGNRFIQYHGFIYSQKGRHHTEEWKRNHSNFMMGRKHALGYRASEETKRKVSASLMGNKHTLGHKLTEEHKQKISFGNQGKIIPEESIRKSADARRGQKRSVEARQRMAVAQKGSKASKETKEKMSRSQKGRKLSEETKRRMSESRKQLWTDPEYRSRAVSAVMLGNKISPNKPETKLLGLLNTLYPKEWAFVGDGTVIFGGKCPDFMNIKDKCLLVELFGDWWHRNDSPRKRMGVFQPYGFRTLVVWERELSNQKTLTRKINRFVNH